MKPIQVVGVILCSMALVLTIPTGIQAAVGHFTEVEGRVDLLRGGKPPTIEVKVQDGVEKGDVVRTKSLSRAQIKFVDDTTLTISPESRVAIEEYLYDNKTGRRQAVLQIFRGIVLTLVSKIIKTEEPNFVIKTHTTVMGVRGTKTYTVLNPISTDIYNERGLVRVKMPWRRFRDPWTWGTWPIPAWVRTCLPPSRCLLRRRIWLKLRPAY